MTDSYVRESNVPIRLPKRGRRGNTKTQLIMDAKHGDSIWVKGDDERSIFYALWWRIYKRGGTALRMTSSKVDNTDPRGPGYRIWFVDPDMYDDDYFQDAK